MNSETLPTSDSSEDVRSADRRVRDAICPPTVRSSGSSESLSETTRVVDGALHGPDIINIGREPCSVAEPNSIPEQIGRYRVIRELGRGGFGTVYLAQDDAADRLVAIKIPRADRTNCSQAKEMFLREARHAAKLKHRNIVTLYEVGEADGQCYLVYEYIE
jgi:serine/threonine protein kinase